MNSPRSGWYPNPENPAEQRYWDGSAWTDHVAPLHAAEPTVTLPPRELPPPPAPPLGPARIAGPRWYQRRWLWIVGGVIALLAAIGAVAPGSDDPSDAGAQVKSPQPT